MKRPLTLSLVIASTLPGIAGAAGVDSFTDPISLDTDTVLHSGGVASNTGPAASAVGGYRFTEAAYETDVRSPVGDRATTVIGGGDLTATFDLNYAGDQGLSTVAYTGPGNNLNADYSGDPTIQVPVLYCSAPMDVFLWVKDATHPGYIAYEHTTQDASTTELNFNLDTLSGGLGDFSDTKYIQLAVYSTVQGESSFEWGPSNPVPAPEPASLGILGIGAVALLRLRVRDASRRRRRCRSPQ